VGRRKAKGIEGAEPSQSQSETVQIEGQAVNAEGFNHVEIVIAALTLILSTVGFLLGSFPLAVIGLVAGGISFGLLLGATKRAN
jgi:hypothetical protein